MATEFGKLGLLGMHLDGYGCAGTERDRVRARLPGARGGRLRHPQLRVGPGVARHVPDLGFGSEEQKQRWLPRMAAGELIGCFGLTEPDAGSDPGVDADARAARRLGLDPGRAKMWITNGSIADVAMVWARTDDGAIRGFVVAKGTPGFTRPGDPPEDLAARIGHLASSCSTTSASRTRTSSRARRRCAGPLSCLNEARYGIVWGAVGAGRACFEAALDYAKERDRLRQADRRVPADTAEARRDGARAQPRLRSSRSTSGA